MTYPRLIPYAAAIVLIGGAIAVAGPVGPAAAASCHHGVASDFNGDGIADVAIGEPSYDHPGVNGGLHVLYGTRSGLTATSPQDALFTPSAENIPASVMVAGDFNGDGCADLAIADPTMNVSGMTFAGEVSLYQGSTSGLESIDEQLFASDSDTGKIMENGRFGSALAVGDVNGDGKDDLLIGAMEESAVYVFLGSNVGIGGGIRYVEGVGGVPGKGGTQSLFGSSLAAGDFDGDGHDDVAIGAYNENAGEGAVVVLRGEASLTAPLTASGAQLWSQDSAGVPGTAEVDDHFGSSLAVGDFRGNGRSDLAIGVPGEAVGTTTLAGAVNVLYSAGSAGLTSSGAQSWTQDSTNVPGVVEVDDEFGAALASGDFNGNGRDDLAIGALGESVGDDKFAGAVNVLPGSSAGLTGSGSSLWNQNTPGISGTAETDDVFGSSLTTVRVRSSARDDLVIGAPGETLGSKFTAGMIHFIPGSSHGLTASGSQAWNDDSSGVKGVSCIECGFGTSIG